jgi:hypothetical protein
MQVDGADPHTGLRADLRLLRLHGIPRARGLEIPRLLAAAEQLGYRAAGTPVDNAVTELLRQAVYRLGESREATAAERSFGLSPGHKLWKAADRRRAAAQVQGVSIETFRKSYEVTLLDQLATEILGLLDELDGAPTAQPAPPDRPVPARFWRQHHVADVLRAAHANADWDLVEGVYLQCVDIARNHEGGLMPDAIPAFFAEALGRMSANYFGREEQLIQHGLGILGNAEHTNKITPELFRLLYTDDRFDRFAQYAGGHDPKRLRRRPRPFETLVETARRFRDLNHLRAALDGLPTSCVLGGSVNYSRYFNVRGQGGELPGSSVDIMLVIPDFDLLDEVIAGLGALPGSSRASLAALAQRSAEWRERRLDDGNTLFSQRIWMWTEEDDPVMDWAPNRGEYPIDLRIASTDVLSWILVAGNPKLTSSSAGSSRSVRDFCERQTVPDEHQRSFSGRDLLIPQDVTELGASRLRVHRAYTIHGERYYPGSAQNLILPRLNTRWENLPIRRQLEMFRWKMIERLRHERRNHPYELLRMSMSHSRSELFAPHILRSVDSGDAT